MKWLFSLLVVLNLGFLAWQIWYPQVASTSSSTAPSPDVKRLVLLREMASTQLKLNPPEKTGATQE